MHFAELLVYLDSILRVKEPDMHIANIDIRSKTIVELIECLEKNNSLVLFWCMNAA